MFEEALMVLKKLVVKGMTMVVVTYEIDFALNVVTRVIFIDEGVSRSDDHLTK